MIEILILACQDCEHIYYKKDSVKCPLCDSPEYEIVDVEYEED